MKSQDIFLLLKLVSLTDATKHAQSALLDEALWQGWGADDAASTSHDALPHMPALDASGATSNVAATVIDTSDLVRLLDSTAVPDTRSLANPLPSVPRPSQADAFSVRSLADTTGISKSEISNILQRCYQSGLARAPRDGTIPSVNRSALADFLIHGIRYVFPVKPSNVTRGIATGISAPVFAGALRAAGETGPVWADPKGAMMGVSIEPLYKTVPIAVRTDPKLYALLALIDSLRIGLPRERQHAAKMLAEILGR